VIATDEEDPFEFFQVSVLLICYHPVTIIGSTLDFEAKELVSSSSCGSFSCLASVWVLLIRCHPVTLMCTTRGRDLSQITFVVSMLLIRCHPVTSTCCAIEGQPEEIILRWVDVVCLLSEDIRCHPVTMITCTEQHFIRDHVPISY